MNDGRISAVISFMRTLVFELASVILLPVVFGIRGIWASVTVAEMASCFISCFFIFRMNRKYRYLRGSFDPVKEARLERGFKRIFQMLMEAAFLRGKGRRAVNRRARMEIFLLLSRT